MGVTTSPPKSNSGVTPAWVPLARLPEDDHVAMGSWTPAYVPEAWTAKANCLGTPDTWFYGEPDKRPALTKDMASFVREVYCQPCPVRATCLTKAFERNEPAGIWGGFSKRGRDAIRRAIQAGTLTMADLLESLERGTDLGFDLEDEE